MCIGKIGPDYIHKVHMIISKSRTWPSGVFILPFQYAGAIYVFVGSHQERMVEPREAKADESVAW